MQPLTASETTTLDTETSADNDHLPNVHPGDVLGADFMEPLGLTAYRVAKDIGVRSTRIGDLLLRRRSVTADTALRLARYFGTTPQFWLNLQTAYDLEEAERQNAAAYQSIGVVPVWEAGMNTPYERIKKAAA